MTNLLTRLFKNAGIVFQPNYGNPFITRNVGKPGINKEGLPRFYPGAKLSRKAAQKAVAVRAARGLRLDGVTV